METFKVRKHVGSDGILKFEFPVSVRDADYEIVVVYTAQPPAEKEDWETFVNRTYGSLADDPIERGEQPPMDIRDAIE